MLSRLSSAVAVLRGQVPHRSEPSRTGKAISARETLSADFAGGWEPPDIELIAKYAVSAPAIEGMITDFLGIKTRPEFLPWAAGFAGNVISDLPVPDDSLRAETIEYIAFFSSLEAAPAGSFTMAELGASYGPWLCVGAVLARRTGRRRARLTALEASSFFFERIPQHLQDNAISLNENIRLVRGALAEKPGRLHFPLVQSAWENGGQAVVGNAERDYVGRTVQHEEVPAYTLDQVLPQETIDFLHIDVQGAEGVVIPAAIDFLSSYVRGLFIGTHSREIEGILLKTMHAAGWRLQRERPVKFEYFADRPSVTGWTTRDGGQFWMNPRV
jgi:FkbM family methyltransferase